MLRTRSLLTVAALALAACSPASTGTEPPPASTPTRTPGAMPLDLGHETLAANDGWAAATSGTTGGAKADAAHTKTATTRKELVDALGDPADTAPRVVYVRGTIDGNVDDTNRALRCGDYATAGYALETYLKAFDPVTFGRDKRPSGTQEDARAASQKKQAERVQIRVGPNTTIVGLDGARLVGVNLLVQNVDNVIIRNITLVDAYDCFPQWDPTDGAQGNWNSQYDNISLKGATHVWIDHNTFSDGDRPDSAQPLYLGRPYQAHDGELDITNASDLVTVSWNRFSDHDKVMLIGSSDTGNTATADRDKLNVTIHHNVFANVGQRTPRVRFGKVHVYDNLYAVTAKTYQYSWGIGIESKLYAENNVFRLAGIGNDRIARAFLGKALQAIGTVIDDGTKMQAIDVLTAYNAANDPKLTSDVGWKPTLATRVDPTDALVATLEKEAGAK